MNRRLSVSGCALPELRPDGGDNDQTSWRCAHCDWWAIVGHATAILTITLDCPHGGHTVPLLDIVVASDPDDSDHLHVLRQIALDLADGASLPGDPDTTPVAAADRTGHHRPARRAPGWLRVVVITTAAALCWAVIFALAALAGSVGSVMSR